MRPTYKKHHNTNGNGAQPRRVDYYRNTEDHECALLGAMGFSTRFIWRETSLSDGQIAYRLKKASIRRMDYRNGDSDLAKMMLRNVRPTAEQQLVKHLKANL